MAPARAAFARLASALGDSIEDYVANDLQYDRRLGDEPNQEDEGGVRRIH
ncbi:MAG: hypothetical protein IPM24_05760 [Bryobacterales bacterium]|nr:hypothetical protein [Bryobacterales bacterium]